MLSPAEVRGRDLKRCVRAAAAFQGIYDDTVLAEAVEVGRGAVAAWWDGAQIKPVTLQRIAEVTGLSLAELTEYVYFGGPLPSLPAVDLSEAVASGEAEGYRRLGNPGQSASDPPAPRLARPPRAG